MQLSVVRMLWWDFERPFTFVVRNVIAQSTLFHCCTMDHFITHLSTRYPFDFPLFSIRDLLIAVVLLVQRRAY